MTLHIALDCFEGLGKDRLLGNLQEYFMNKSYNVMLVNQHDLTSRIHTLKDYNLTISENALLQALDRSIIWNNTDFTGFDLVIWDESVLSSYINHTDSEVKASFIQAINRFFPAMDLYIMIQHPANKKQDFIKKSNFSKKHNIVFLNQNSGNLCADIVKVIFEKLPTCKWCGRLFRKNATNKKYCSDNCKDYAKEEQNRDNFRNYYNRYKDTMSESQKGALGSMGANLHGRANNDLEVESRLIKNEMRRLGL